MLSAETRTSPSQTGDLTRWTDRSIVSLSALPVDPLYPEPVSHRSWIAEQPLPWLGPGPRRHAVRDLPDLVSDGVVTPEAAMMLERLIGHRASVLVVADRSMAGKSTLLEALLRHYPVGNRRIRLRGAFETFGWETDPRFNPAQAVLIAEEISGFLPTYLWGPPVGRFIGWRERGCSLAATAHADSVEDVARLLSGYPLRLPLSATAAFDLLVRLGPSQTGTSARFVLSDIWSSSVTTDGGLIRSVLLDRDGPRDDAIAVVEQRLGCDRSECLSADAGTTGRSLRA